MRTTLTLDDDVARLLSDAQHRERKSLKQVVNEALRRGLTESVADRPAYRVRPHHSGVRPGIDVTALNRLADELEDDGLIAGRS
ncbi:MAG: antitoxin [Actinomycetales bacterium]|nr:antitoxin [Candidatus Phosphoribacter baldrii]